MKESIYIVSSIAVFAMIGLLTGYAHGHGGDAGAACGGLAGFVLAVTVPAMLGTSFLSQRRMLQCGIAVIALILLLLIVAVMYAHVIDDFVRL